MIEAGSTKNVAIMVNRHSREKARMPHAVHREEWLMGFGGVGYSRPRIAHSNSKAFSLEEHRPVGGVLHFRDSGDHRAPSLRWGKDEAFGSNL